MNRRSFLHLGASAAALSLLPRRSPAAFANGMLNHCAIGVSGQGGSDLGQLAGHPKFKLVAAVDIDQGNLDRLKADERFKEVRTYRDWREMLVAEGDKIDSVNIATPDHMHGIISLSAMNLGKHVYCEKPLTQTVAEARRMRLTADAKQVITQMGNQIHSDIAYRLGVAWLREGAIGKIKEVHSWTGATFPQKARPDGEDPVPDSLSWDLWLGGAQAVPYKKGLYHPFQWRGWQSFGGGGLGDFGCHIWDPPFTALELTAPISLSSEVCPEWAADPKRSKESWPDWEIYRTVFPGTPFCAGETIPLTWYGGGKRPDKALVQLPEGRDLPGGGSIFIGTEGQMVLPHVGGPQLYPFDTFKGHPKPDLPKHINHYRTWIDHVLEGKRTTDGFHYSGPLTEAVQLGNIANRFPGQTLKWDTAALRFTNNDAANVLIDPPYREGWKVLG